MQRKKPASPMLWRRHRLALLYGGEDWRVRTQVLQALSCQLNIPYIPLGVQVTLRLLEIPPDKRPFQVEAILQEIIHPLPPAIGLDHIEVLFQTELRFRPLEWLRTLAESRWIVASWPGEIEPDQQKARYAVPGHPEFREFTLSQVELLYAPNLASELLSA